MRAWLLCRGAGIILIESSLIASSNLLAFWLRFDGDIPHEYVGVLERTLPWIVAIRLLTFFPFSLYASFWRYTSIWDLRKIVLAVTTSSALLYLTFTIHPGIDYPGSILAIDALVLLCLMIGARVVRRTLKSRLGPHKAGKRPVLIYGAGHAGEMAARDLYQDADSDVFPVGFIDDDPGKIGRRIHGIRVLGTRRDLKRVLSGRDIHEILIAMPTAAGQLRAILKALQSYDVRVTTLPRLGDLVAGRVTVSAASALALEDLLPRPPITLAAGPVRRLIARRCVLVTGAGGSIGSELSRQIAAMKPATLILLEWHENSLYAIENQLRARNPDVAILPAVGDVTDRDRLAAIFTTYRPDLVFHAAAHKHVPLMEANPCEAVKNNVGGTRAVAEAAQAFGASQVVLISTDKAVNPTSAMGATKRVAELILQGMEGETTFTCVRFGNVLGSNGSVVPRFLEQIAAGGPVTVTHPKMKRYFMLIPEAVQLVLHAAALGGSGVIYVLEMGEECNVLELAKNLIRLSGYEPDKDIEVVFTGLRPGEKLSEELIGSKEQAEEVIPGKVQRVHPVALPSTSELKPLLLQLEEAARNGDVAETRRLLGALVPTYRPYDAAPASTTHYPDTSSTSLLAPHLLTPRAADG